MKLVSFKCFHVFPHVQNVCEVGVLLRVFVSQLLLTQTRPYRQLECAEEEWGICKNLLMLLLPKMTTLLPGSSSAASNYISDNVWGRVWEGWHSNEAWDNVWGRVWEGWRSNEASELGAFNKTTTLWPVYIFKAPPPRLPSLPRKFFFCSIAEV